MAGPGLSYDVGHVMATVAKSAAWVHAGVTIWNKPSLIVAATAIAIAAGVHAVMTACQAAIDLAGRKRNTE